MNTALWIAQIMLAAAFTFSGVFKMLTPKEQLQSKMPWAEDFSPGMIKFIGAVELLAAIGLIVPWLTGIAPVLTPLAAAGLVAVMIGAAAVHIKRKEWSGLVPNLVLGGLALFVAVNRF